MTSLHILLEARSAVRHCWRAYEIEVGADLFGAWRVEMSYGRIGTMGRSKIRSFATAADAQAEVDGCLRKRASAPRRIGVAYRLRRASQAADWSQPGLARISHTGKQWRLDRGSGVDLGWGKTSKRRRALEC